MKVTVQVYNQLTPEAKRLVRKYRRLMLNELQLYMNRVRRGAIDEVIPTRFPNVRSNMRLLYKFQPSTPGKLTERTGLLLKMLKDFTPWRITTINSRSTEGNAMQGHIKLATGKSMIETYEGTWKGNVRSIGGYLGRSKRRVTPQQATMRFKWESGIKGEKRQIFDPAARKIKTRTESIMQAKLNDLQKIGISI